MKPLSWKKPRHVFVCSMTDLFLENVPDEWIDKVLAVMARTPQHTFQILTKRADRMRRYMTGVSLAPTAERDAVLGRDWPLPNVWLCTSAEDQHWYDVRSRDLEKTPASKRFLSLEPLLGPIDLRLDEDFGRRSRMFHWVITGGESGQSARPSHPDWFRDIRDQCVAEGVPFFHKQNGEFVSVSEVEGPGRHHTFNDGSTVRRVGKKRAGRTLDGRTWEEMPT